MVIESNAFAILVGILWLYFLFKNEIQINKGYVHLWEGES